MGLALALPFAARRLKLDTHRSTWRSRKEIECQITRRLEPWANPLESPYEPLHTTNNWGCWFQPARSTGVPCLRRFPHRPRRHHLQDACHRSVASWHRRTILPERAYAFWSGRGRPAVRNRGLRTRNPPRRIGSNDCVVVHGPVRAGRRLDSRHEAPSGLRRRLAVASASGDRVAFGDWRPAETGERARLRTARTVVDAFSPANANFVRVRWGGR